MAGTVWEREYAKKNMQVRLRTFAGAAMIAASLAAAAQQSGDQLFAAARTGDLPAAKKLIESGVDVNSKGPYDQTAIFFAADRGHAEMVRLLVDKGANVNHKDSFYQMTALTRASMKKRYEVMKLLLDRGAEGASQVSMQAVQSGDLEMLKVALGSGKLTAKDLSLSLAAAEKMKKDPMVEALKGAGAQPLPPANFKVASAVLQSYAGKYAGGRGGTTEVEVILEGEVLKAKAMGATYTLGATSTTEFQLVEEPVVTAEFRLTDGKVTELVLQPGDQRYLRKAEAK